MNPSKMNMVHFLFLDSFLIIILYYSYYLPPMM